MDIRLDSRCEYLIQQQLRSGRYQSVEQVVISGLDALNQNEQTPQSDERKRAVQDMLEFAGRHGFTLGAEFRIQDLIHQGHKY